MTTTFLGSGATARQRGSRFDGRAVAGGRGLRGLPSGVKGATDGLATRGRRRCWPGLPNARGGSSAGGSAGGGSVGFRRSCGSGLAWPPWACRHGRRQPTPLAATDISGPWPSETSIVSFRYFSSHQAPLRHITPGGLRRVPATPRKCRTGFSNTRVACFPSHDDASCTLSHCAPISEFASVCRKDLCELRN